MENMRRLTRRDFLKGAAKTAAVVAVSGVLPSITGGCSSDSDAPLTVTTSIQTSDAQEALAVADSPHEIILTFSEPLNLETVEGMVSLQTVKVGGELKPTEPPVEILVDTQQPTQVIIRTEDGSKLLSGEEYKLVVGSGVTAVSGLKMSQEYVRYFATDYDLSLDPIPELGNDRTITYVISDIHMGDQRSIDGGYGWFVKNRDKLVSFLNLVRQHANAKELVIAGDMFDEWVAPMTSDPLNGMSHSEFFDTIIDANWEIVDAINAIITDGAITVTYVPGNHDMLVESDDMQRNFPGISEARDAHGLGAYTPLGHPEIIIEHGHRYDFFNSPDPLSNRSITQTNSILPPGFFVTKIATTSDIETGKTTFWLQQLSDELGSEDAARYIEYWEAWQLIMKFKPVKADWADKIIKTGVDGYTDLYAINDLIPRGIPLDVTLYKEILNRWYDRQAINKVSKPLTAVIAMAMHPLVLNAQSNNQYFFNKSSNKRIVVFGHSHKATAYTTLDHKLRFAICANSGTWVDNGKVSCTFVRIIPPKDNSTTTETVTVCQYVGDGDIKEIERAAIRV